MAMSARTIAKIVLVLSIIGIVDSAYATYEHYALLSESEQGSFCDINAAVSCTAVNTSPYSEMFGIPTAFYGVMWFLVTVVLGYQLLKEHKSGFWKNTPFYLFAWSIVGLLTVFWLVYAELFLIGAICLLCTIVHIIVIIILVLSYKALHKSPRAYLKDIFYK